MLSLDEITCIKEQSFIAASYNYKDIARIKPLTIKEILTMGRQNYEMKLALLLLTDTEAISLIQKKTKENIDLKTFSVLSYLLQSAEYDDTFYLELVDAFSTFIQEEILLLPKISSIVIGNPEQKRLITPENYNDFQQILCIQNGRKVKEPPPENESAIAREFRLKREMREAIKQKQKKKNNQTQSFLDMLEIAEVYGIDYLNSTIFSLQRKIQRHQAKEKWDQDFKLLCAGLDAKKIEMSYWGDKLEDK